MFLSSLCCIPQYWTVYLLFKKHTFHCFPPLRATSYYEINPCFTYLLYFPFPSPLCWSEIRSMKNSLGETHSDINHGLLPPYMFCLTFLSTTPFFCSQLHITCQFRPHQSLSTYTPAHNVHNNNIWSVSWQKPPCKVRLSRITNPSKHM